MDKFSNREFLFDKLKAYDSKAQKALYNEVFPKLCKISFKIVKNREEAKDIAIDRFQKCLAIVREMENYEHLLSVLFTATKNLSFNYLRDKGNWNKRHLDPIHLDKVADNTTMNDIIEHEIEAAIRNYMADDNEINRMVAQLAFVEGLSNQEIVDLLGIDEKSVRNRKSRMLPGLRDALRKGGFYIFF
jgi:RNA polymerase sigma-70 factor (ECF subfamily)